MPMVSRLEILLRFIDIHPNLFIVTLFILIACLITVISILGHYLSVLFRGWPCDSGNSLYISPEEIDESST